MIWSKYTKLVKNTKDKCIVDAVDVKDVYVGDNGAYELTATYFLVVEPEQWEAFIAEQAGQQAEAQKTEQDKKLAEACDTILKTDPFGAQYNGYKLIDIVKTDYLWLDKALKEMKNQYIVNRLIIIKEAIDNGKIEI